MTNINVTSLLLSLLCIFCSATQAQDESDYVVEDKVELTTTFIKGNKELPQTLYIVPWQTVKKKNTPPENMVLHSLYGDIFQPILPAALVEYPDKLQVK